MTREEAINVLKTRSCYECSWGCDSPVSCHCGGCDLTEATEMAIEALEAQGWIPTKERLPDESGWYIVTWEDMSKISRRLSTAKFIKYNSGLGRFEHYEWSGIIAWMPFPEVYRGDRDEENN